MMSIVRERRRIVFAIAGLFAGEAFSPTATAVQEASPTTAKKDKNVAAGERRLRNCSC
jgi:hypothetical protein